MPGPYFVLICFDRAFKNVNFVLLDHWQVVLLLAEPPFETRGLDLVGALPCERVQVRLGHDPGALGEVLRVPLHVLLHSGVHLLVVLLVYTDELVTVVVF
jgi:hypothetical protein